jgi:leukotriene-A4 hydrolase
MIFLTKFTLVFKIGYTLSFLCLIGIFTIWMPSCTQSPKIINEKNMKSDVHSFSNPNQVVVTHIRLDLALDFNKRTISGFAKLSLNNKTQTDKLILDSRDLSISKIVLDDGKETTYSLGENKKHLGQALTIAISAKTNNVTIYYTTSPDAAAIQWLQTKGKAPFLFTQSQAILARSWVPCQDSPGIKFTYDAKIKVPENLMALMSAENDTLKHADGIYTFNMPQPISSYLLALTVGDFKFKPLGANCGVYAEPDMIDKAAWEFADMEKMITTAETLYGPYRWGRYDVVVLPASFPFGGMENPRLTFATPTIISGDRSLVALIAHELAHSWSGNLVTNATWNDFWLNEGFTVYFENRIMEALYGKEYSNMLEYLGFYDLKKTVAELGDTSAKTHLLLDMKDEDPDDGVNDIAYEKGRFFLRTIEETVGRKAWDEFLINYFNKHAFKAMDTYSFLECLDKELIKGNKEIKEKINSNAWVFGPGIPANVPAVKAVAFEKVDAELTLWNNEKKASQLHTKNWNTHQWLHFLRNLPKQLSYNKMKELDGAFNFTNSGNCEILCDWYQQCITNNYKDANKNIESFLIRVGRRKFIVPLYEKLLKTPEGKTFAIDAFEKAKEGYHPLTKETISDLIKENS